MKIKKAQVIGALDTGASTNFIQEKIARKYRPLKTTVLLANKETSTIATGMWEGKITINNQKYVEKFLIVPDLREQVILGHKRLATTKVTMDYSRQCIHHRLTHRVTTFWVSHKQPKLTNPDANHEFPPNVQKLLKVC